MIMKLLLIIGVIGFVYFFFIKKKPAVTKKDESTSKKKEKLQGNDMIECKSCGIFFEVDDGILSGSEYYCSSECVTKAKS